jgi:uroporphyrinogen III methyltransferase/synthase
MTIGKVYLVGAGPGDPKLITMKGLECIQKADVLVYDRLSSPRLLRYARPDCERIYVGKQPDRHTRSQEEINWLLVRKAQEGKIVTRLKGGDPCVFGRVGEEAELLAEHNIEFEIVPGITSAIAVPAYAGIPVTSRGVSPSFTVVAGHEDPSKGESAVDWQALAKMTGTTIFLMGVANLEKIVDRLLQYGKSPATPVALIRWGTRAEQRTLVGTLEDIVQKVRETGFRAPATIVIGDVVSLRQKLMWYEKKPLFGQRILVTRSREQASALCEQIEEWGGDPYEFPVIRTVLPKDLRPLDEAIGRVQEFDWILFTSANAVKFFFARMFQLNQDIRRIRARIAAVGSKTAECLREKGILADVIPSESRQEGLLEALEKELESGEKILFPRSALARRTLADGLRAGGFDVTEVDAYETQPVADQAQEVADLLARGKIHMITFTSSSTVRNFLAAMPDEHLPQLLQNVTIAAIGPITANTAREYGLRVDLVAEEPTIESLVTALAKSGRALSNADIANEAWTASAER